MLKFIIDRTGWSSIGEVRAGHAGRQGTRGEGLPQMWAGGDHQFVYAPATFGGREQGAASARLQCPWGVEGSLGGRRAWAPARFRREPVSATLEGSPRA